VAAGALPDGTPVIISGGGDSTARVWRTSGPDPHLEVILALRVRASRHHQEVPGALYRAAQIQAGPAPPPAPLPDEFPRGPRSDQRIG
jgi:hypothetical protein